MTLAIGDQSDKGRAESAENIGDGRIAAPSRVKRRPNTPPPGRTSDEIAEFLKKKGVAAMLSLSPRKIDSMTAAGELPHVRLSKRCILYPRQGVLDALAARTIGVK